jgi:hypothetical protein
MKWNPVPGLMPGPNEIVLLTRKNMPPVTGSYDCNRFRFVCICGAIDGMDVTNWAVIPPVPKKTWSGFQPNGCHVSYSQIGPNGKKQYVGTTPNGLLVIWNEDGKSLTGGFNLE